MHRKVLAALIVGAAAWLAPATARGQAAEEELVVEAGQVLREIMAIPARGIPRALLADARGLVIVPGMIRGGFVIGVKHGRGIAVPRDAEGAWGNPVFVRVNGGNIGFQAGLQATDVILVFRTRTSVDAMMRGRFTIGANAGVAAGPVGRETSAATDAQMRAEILSYSRSRGLFAGVAIDGAMIQPDPRATAAFYGQTPAQPQGVAPPSAGQFLSILNAYSGAQAEAVIPIPREDRETLVKHLTAAHQRLTALLDPAWQQFLALPADLTGTTPASREGLQKARTRFNDLVNDPKFRALVERQEFQETLTLLNRHALLEEAGATAVLTLPPPPAKP
jgi:SH3 domain-containing YSC84-like protein 1